MPENRETIAAVAKANGKLTLAKHNKDPKAEKQARKELKEALAAYDK